MNMRSLKVLCAMQLSEKLESGQNRLGVIGKGIIHMGFSYGIFVAVFLGLKFLNVFSTINIFTTVVLALQVISVISATAYLTRSLYLSKDNQLLLTYPVKSFQLVLSKLIVAYILELIKSLYFMFPIFMSYMTIYTDVVSITYIVFAVIYSLLLPLFPVLIGSILAAPVMLVTKFIGKSTAAKAAGSVLLIAGAGVLTYYIISIIPFELNIRDSFISFFTGLDSLCSAINNYSLYCYFIGRVMYGYDVLSGNLIILGMLVVLGAAALLITYPLFFKMASMISEDSFQKNHKAVNTFHKNTFVTFMRKELKLSVRNIGDFISSYIFLFLMPFVVLIVSMIYVHMERDYIGVGLTYGFIGLLVFVMASASNTAAASAVSSEGSEFVLLKTAPGKTSNIIWAKLLINFIMSALFITITFIALSVFIPPYIAERYGDAALTYFNTKYIWLFYPYIILTDFGLILWSIQMDIVSPSLREYANSQSGDDLKNSGKSILMGCIASVIFSGLLILLYLLLPIEITLIVLYAVAVIFAAIRLYFLINYRDAYFADIQL